MPQTEYLTITRNRPPTTLARWFNAVRSFTIGPTNLKDPELAKLFAGTASSTGLSVNESSALSYAPFWAAVNLIANDISSLPLVLYRRVGAGKDRYSDHPLYRLLHDQPNPEMTSKVFRQTLQAHALTWGNGYAEIERDGVGRPRALWPLTPDRVTPFRAPSGALAYKVHNPLTNRDVEFRAADIVHVPGLGYDGTMGYSVVAKARESLGLGLATERFGGSFFGNGSTFGGVLSSEKPLSDKARESLTKALNARHQGVENAHRFLLLELGFKYQTLGIPANDAQFLETRQFQVADIARWFNIPPHKIGDLSRSTYSNIEQQTIDYYTATLRPWLVTWEQELTVKLVSALERNLQLVEHVTEGLLRGDAAGRAEFYSKLFSIGAVTINEIRARENFNPLPGGDTSYVPLNMIPLDRVGEMIDKQLQPARAPAAADEDEEDEEESESARALRDRLTALTGQFDALRIAAATLESQLTHTQAERKTAEDALIEARSEVARLQATEAALTTHLTDARAQVETVTQQQTAALEGLRAELAHTTTQRQAAEDALVAERLAVTEARAQVEVITVELARVREARAAADRTVTDMTEALAIAADTRAEHEQTIRDHEGTIHTITAHADALRAQVEQVMSEYAESQTALQTQTEALRQLQTTLDTAMEAQARALADAASALARADLADVAQSEARQAQEAAEQRARVAQEDAARATEALAAVEAARDAHAQTVTTLRETSDARTIALITASRAVMVEALNRLIRRETEKARSKRATAAKLRAWAESFYAEHERALWCEALLPAVAMHLALMGNEQTPADVARVIVDAHMDYSRRQIGRVADSDPEDYHRALDVTLDHWETTRAETVADTLMREEIRYVRSYA